MLHQNRVLQGCSALKSSEGLLIHELYSFLEQIASCRLRYRVAWLILMAESLRVRDRRAKTSKFICVRQVNFTFEALVSSPNHCILTAESERNLHLKSTTAAQHASASGGHELVIQPADTSWSYTECATDAQAGDRQVGRKAQLSNITAAKTYVSL